MLQGWVGTVSTKQRRAVERIIRALVDSGVVERVAAGDKKILCIRLTKYRTELDNDALEISDNPKREVQKEWDCLQGSCWLRTRVEAVVLTLFETQQSLTERLINQQAVYQ